MLFGKKKKAAPKATSPVKKTKKPSSSKAADAKAIQKKMQEKADEACPFC